MIWLLPGAAAFVFFLLFDWGKASGSRYAPAAFILGGLLLMASTVALLLPGTFTGQPLWRKACGIVSLLWLAALLYVLFGALPAKKTYAGSVNGLPLCKTGPYALCRHPGGWCFLFMYLFLWLYASGTQMFAAAVLFSALNFLYIWIQDRYLFPKYIESYELYKQEVPFLVPTRHSIQAFLKKGSDQSA